jgi:hypothetical protein
MFNFDVQQTALYYSIKEKFERQFDNFLFGDYVQVLFASGSLDDHNAAFLKSDLLEVIC